MKKKLLAVAMGAMLAAGAANAVTVNHAGLGDLLVSPAYSIGGGSQSAPGAAFDIAVRDSEGLGYAAFSLIPGDVWHATISATAEPHYKIRIQRSPERQRMQT